MRNTLLEQCGENISKDLVNRICGDFDNNRNILMERSHGVKLTSHDHNGMMNATIPKSLFKKDAGRNKKTENDSNPNNTGADPLEDSNQDDFGTRIINGFASMNNDFRHRMDLMLNHSSSMNSDNFADILSTMEPADVLVSIQERIKDPEMAKICATQLGFSHDAQTLLGIASQTGASFADLAKMSALSNGGEKIADFLNGANITSLKEETYKDLYRDAASQAKANFLPQAEKLGARHWIQNSGRRLMGDLVVDIGSSGASVPKWIYQSQLDRYNIAERNLEKMETSGKGSINDYLFDNEQWLHFSQGELSALQNSEKPNTILREIINQRKIEAQTGLDYWNKEVDDLKKDVYMNPPESFSAKITEGVIKQGAKMARNNALGAFAMPFKLNDGLNALESILGGDKTEDGSKNSQHNEDNTYPGDGIPPIDATGDQISEKVIPEYIFGNESENNNNDEDKDKEDEKDDSNEGAE